MKKVFLFLGFVMFSLGIVACGTESDSASKIDDSLSKIKDSGIVRIGVFGDKYPFGYVDKNGNNAGFDVYIAKRIAKDLLGENGKLELVALEAANRVEFLKSNKVDIVLANFTKTPERAEVVDFSMPYMKVALGIVSKNGEISNISQLKKLIVNKGTTADIYFTKNHPEIELLKFEQNTEAFLALKSGRADALAHDNALLFAWAMEPENAGFSVSIAKIGEEDTINPAVAKGNPELLKWLNDEMKALQDALFFQEAYDAELLKVYGKDIDSKNIIF